MYIAHKIESYIDFPSHITVNELLGNVLTLSLVFWHLGVALPISVGGVGIQSGRCGMGDPGSANNTLNLKLVTFFLD